MQEEACPRPPHLCLLIGHRHHQAVSPALPRLQGRRPVARGGLAARLQRRTWRRADVLASVCRLRCHSFPWCCWQRRCSPNRRWHVSTRPVWTRCGCWMPAQCGRHWGTRPRLGWCSSTRRPADTAWLSRPPGRPWPETSTRKAKLGSHRTINPRETLRSGDGPCFSLSRSSRISSCSGQTSCRTPGLSDWHNQFCVTGPEWEPAIRIGVLDCGDEGNFEACKEYGIQYYPTFRYFRAFAKQFSVGENQHGSDREPQTVRQSMIDFLQNHSQEAKPPARPHLDPIAPEEIFLLLNRRAPHYTAIVFESANSYVGREVILDLNQYENIVVKRALNSDPTFLEKLSITSVPSTYLIHPNGSHEIMNVLKPLRSFFSSYLKSLPGVRRRLSSPPLTPVRQNREEKTDTKEWKDFDKLKLYMDDLESGLHYLLRVELATHKTLEGAQLKTFKDVVTVLAKLFPGSQPVMKLLETLQVWVVSFPLDKIPYDAVLDLLNNKMRISGLHLPSHIRWVSCQGSRPELRGYPCSFWELFHTLSVQAALQPKALLHTGDLSEDPKFPKLQWPTPEICPECHEEIKGLHTWNKAEVLRFLKHHYSPDNLVFASPEDHQDNTGFQEEEERKDLKNRGGRNEDRNPGSEKLLAAKSKVFDRLISKESAVKDRGRKKAELEMEEEMKQAVSFLGIGFSNVDMSLCIVLYVASSLFLIIMYFFFRMRSKRWKVRYPRPYV
uniref:Sulfhydryl oxidase n=1 Tax=Salvator merianae TaxID=96440 RepID=A0A8D0E7K3_SALMN